MWCWNTPRHLENVVLDYYLIDGFLQIRRNKGKTKAYKGRKTKQ